MELDDLKNTWEEVNSREGKKKNLTSEIIDRITQTKYNENMKKITYPEIIGALICIIGAVYIGTNFTKLDTDFLQVTSAVSILLLILIPVLSLLSIRKFNLRENVNNTYTEALKEYAVQKIKFHKFQLVNITLSYLLLVSVIILLPKLFSGKDITSGNNYWFLVFPLGYIFLFFFSKLVMKNYKNTLRQAENLLKDISSLQS